MLTYYIFELDYSCHTVVFLNQGKPNLSMFKLIERSSVKKGGEDKIKK